MGQRIKVLLIFSVVLAAGALLGSAITQWLTVAPVSRERPLPQIGERIRVEVLNSGGEQGAARVATDELRSLGFDVVYFGNAEAFDAEMSAVVDRAGRLEAARAVADALGIGNVRSEPDTSLYLDTTVRLGRDWVPLSQRVIPGDESEGEPWWDLRRFLR
ncbi:LytR C-terminal domain-containing protein [Gemmatimonadota bacterium]